MGMNPRLRRRASFALSLVALCVAPAAATSCGGAIFSDSGDAGPDGGVSGSGGGAGAAGRGGAGGGPGGTGMAGTGTGGVGGDFAGVGGFGGDVIGGSDGAGGGVGGTGGVGGAGGGGPSACSLPRDAGSCDAAMPVWWHNPDSGVCEPFIYGGCGGNDNRFPIARRVRRRVPRSRYGLDACMIPTDCQLAPRGVAVRANPWTTARSYPSTSRKSRDTGATTAARSTAPPAPHRCPARPPANIFAHLPQRAVHGHRHPPNHAHGMHGGHRLRAAQRHGLLRRLRHLEPGRSQR